MLSMLGGIVGDQAVQEAMRVYSGAWAFKHPSPWDFVFLMSNELDMDLGWFWYYWLWTTESVDASIQNVQGTGSGTTVTVHQAGQMPSPIVLHVELKDPNARREMQKNAIAQQDGSVIVTWPVDVWFGGDRSFDAELGFAKNDIAKITLDPGGRFPDANKRDNTWPNRRRQ